MSNPPQEQLHAVIDEVGRVLDKLGDQLAATVQEADRECRTIGIACRGQTGAMLRENCDEIDAAMNDAIVALQYQDLMAQRVVNIRAGLDKLQENLRDGITRTYGEWLELLRSVERLHNLEQQRLLRAPVPSDSGVELF
jgi:DNA anti-recombination protein RmuC